jgi:hypothetical protein
MKSLLLAVTAMLSLSAFAQDFDLSDAVETKSHNHHYGKLYKCTATDAYRVRYSMKSNRKQNLAWKALHVCQDYSYAPQTCRVVDCRRIR